MRLKVRAGLTGYAQVYVKYNTTPYDKLKLDLIYIEKYSVLMDLQLIATTIKILFQKENTEGIEEWQVTADGRDDRLPEAKKRKYSLKGEQRMNERRVRCWFLYACLPIMPRKRS